MRQPFGTVACCGLVILQLAREIEVFGGNPTLLPLCTLQSMWTSMGLNLYLCTEKLVTSHWS